MHAPPAALATLRAEIDRIPLTRAMGLAVEGFDGDALTLAAPLAPNVNDKGCAFGGSLASLMTLAGWGLLELALEARALHADIYVQDSSIRYIAPVWHDFRAIAAAAPGESLDAFAAALAERGKARLRVHCRVPLPDGGDAATLDARFVALAAR
ncbi:thioesterase domain-containing protein [Dokdonella fugitiva]|uniref:Thioesterase domain-containing protein n=1 Tax=Dokdonella fugitiva TaxID=328517 RepID=A0A839F2F9_9GAMM|nr:YiiD C-terminal domain-containing protein [Dokdonella fugitiva]MBA8887688.1 thioesterase domain-containing protein [Dokdonella fugitiva]